MARANKTGFGGRGNGANRRRSVNKSIGFEALEDRHMMSGVSLLAPSEGLLPFGVAADAYEVDNTLAQARTISTNGQTQTHSIHTKTDLDYVQFTLAATSNVVIETDGKSGDTELRLYDGGGTQIAYNNDYNRYFSRISASNLAAGTYYARVNEYGMNATISSYTIKVTATVPVVGDAYEVDNTMAQAKTIAVGGAAQSHSIHVIGDVDWVKFTLDATTSVVIATNGSVGDTQLTLYNSSGSQLATNDDYGGSTFSQISMSLAAGTYYAKVNEFGNNATIASYTLQVTGSSSATTNYMLCTAWGGTWTDADKSTTNTDDDLMCWAATTSNMLQWTGWGRAGGMTTADQIFTYYQNHWSDQGGHAYYGGEWWFDGINAMQGVSGWSQVEVAGGRFFPSQNYFNYVHCTTDITQVMSALNSYLHAGYAVGLGLGGAGGHAVTCWGYEFAAGSPTSYKGIYITDSDDNQSNPSGDFLKYYPVTQVNGRWYLQNFYGTNNSWYITDVTGLDRRPSTVGINERAAAARVLLGRCGDTASPEAVDLAAGDQAAVVEQPMSEAQGKLLVDTNGGVAAYAAERRHAVQPQASNVATPAPQRAEESHMTRLEETPVSLRLMACDAVLAHGV